MHNASVMPCNAPITLCYALYGLQLAHTEGECILRRGGNDAVFPNDFGEDLFCNVYWLVVCVLCIFVTGITECSIDCVKYFAVLSMFCCRILLPLILPVFVCFGICRTDFCSLNTLLSPNQQCTKHRRGLVLCEQSTEGGLYNVNKASKGGLYNVTLKTNHK